MRSLCRFWLRRGGSAAACASSGNLASVFVTRRAFCASWLLRQLQQPEVAAPPQVAMPSTAKPLPKADSSRMKGINVSVVDHLNHPLTVQPLRSFSDLAEEFPPWLNAGITATGYESPMAVQAVAIPLLLEERDVIGLAPTGTGKTVAFAIPSLANIKPIPQQQDKVARPSILVLCPTRELVQQTARVFEALSGNVIRVGECFGGSDRQEQLAFLRRRGCDVLVATPGRLCDFVEVGGVDVSQVVFLVFDEADRMLEMGFTTQIEYIMEGMRSNKAEERPRRTMMWSATWPREVQSLAQRFLLPSRVTIKAGGADLQNKDIEQHVYIVKRKEEKFEKLIELYDKEILNPYQKVLLFVDRKDGLESFCEEIRKMLNQRFQYPPGGITTLHGSQRQSKRDAIVERFRSDDIRFLVATDIASRGLDIPLIDHVINFEPPRSIDLYVHRIGRTGRAGKKGMAHTFIDSTNGAFAFELLQFMQKTKVPNIPKELTQAALEYGGSRRSAPRRFYSDQEVRGFSHNGGWRFSSKQATE